LNLTFAKKIGFGGYEWQLEVSREQMPITYYPRTMCYRYCSDLRNVKLFTPEALQEVLSAAQSGKAEARAELLTWLYRTALDYFYSKVSIEQRLSAEDAQDLACETVIEFSKSWLGVQTPIHYARRMMKNNLARFLKKERLRCQRVCALDSDVVERLEKRGQRHTGFHEDDSIDDNDRIKCHLIQHEMSHADASIQSIIHYRVLAGSLTYAEIAGILNTSDTSLRMRMTRFKHRVRERHDLIRARRDRVSVQHRLVGDLAA